MRIILAAILAFALAACTAAPEPAPEPITLVLGGEITRADHQTYREIPFTVPAGTTRIAVDLTYDKSNRTVIDLGLRDPQGLRGWSGGNKARFEITETNATPSYQPGPIQPGEWNLILGIPNIRDGQTARYTATVTLIPASRTAPAQADGRGTLRTAIIRRENPGWYRGDFHTHTAHSDGSCGPEGARLPCPTINTAKAAHDAGLDFVAITDHNTITQLADIRALRADYPDTLLIPGTEITTFQGHANVIGNTDFVEFQLGSPRLPSFETLFDTVDAAGGILSINHPSLPSGEICMGCGWTVKDTDWSRVTAIEVINGSTLRTAGAEAPMSGIAFWDTLLKQGHRITAIGGSDNHDATDTSGERQSPVGKPATVVYASDLSAQGIIAGVRSGRVFIDVAGLPDAELDANAVGGGSVTMGGEVWLAEGNTAILTARLRNTPEWSRLSWVLHNVTLEAGRLAPGFRDEPALKLYSFPAALAPGAAHGYARPELRDSSGKLLLLGNPIYFRRVPSG